MFTADTREDPAPAPGANAAASASKSAAAATIGHRSIVAVLVISRNAPWSHGIPRRGHRVFLVRVTQPKTEARPQPRLGLT